MKNFMMLTLALALVSSTAFAKTSTQTTTTQTAQVAETPTTTTVTTTTNTATSTTKTVERKGSMNAGVMALGYYEYSTFESLYVDFTTDHITATGLGFRGFYEYGISERLAVGGALSLNYLMDANFNLAVLTRTFWNADVLGTFYFTDYDSFIQPYVAFGAGILFSKKGVAPVLDIGGGAHFKLSDNLSIKAELMGKSGVIHNRAEAGLGVAFHF